MAKLGSASASIAAIAIMRNMKTPLWFETPCGAQTSKALARCKCRARSHFFTGSFRRLAENDTP
jgi:hypothetical protein